METDAAEFRTKLILVLVRQGHRHFSVRVSVPSLGVALEGREETSRNPLSLV